MTMAIEAKDIAMEKYVLPRKKLDKMFENYVISEISEAKKSRSYVKMSCSSLHSRSSYDDTHQYVDYFIVNTKLEFEEDVIKQWLTDMSDSKILR